jgi:hypothetical protein
MNDVGSKWEEFALSSSDDQNKRILPHRNDWALNELKHSPPYDTGTTDAAAVSCCGLLVVVVVVVSRMGSCSYWLSRW